MVKVKTVRRSYFSKKAGKIITKEYQYEVKPPKPKRTQAASKLLVTKAGKVNVKNIKRLVKEFNLGHFNENDVFVPEGQLGAEINLILKGAARHKQRLTGFEALAKGTTEQRERMLLNAGLTFDDLNEKGISRTAWLNPKNWRNGAKTYETTTRKGKKYSAHVQIFTADDGSEWEYKFSYEGDSLERISAPEYDYELDEDEEE